MYGKMLVTYCQEMRVTSACLLCTHPKSCMIDGKKSDKEDMLQG
jgi:hypothetical protein